jgi:bifunctional DNA-binding transcriptional regulator/antitoxin component of YhaV-PrlF toxin-antitoxin module
LKTITVDSTGSVGLPTEALQQSGIQPGSSVVVLAREGRIILLDRERFRDRIEKPMEEMLARLHRSIEQRPQAPFSDGLTYEEYAALSDEDEQALWDRLTAEAVKQVDNAERDIPPHFRPAGQKRR